ncbi:MAG: R3H domain-containing nucleic acid-binding protein [Patescibacteria group bacterium]
MPNQEKIKEQIQKLLGLLGVAGSIIIEDRAGSLVFNIKTEDSRLLIGQHGANLNALQHLARLLARKELGAEEQMVEFFLDVEDYRKNREEFLNELARQAASRVRDTKQTLILKPMSGYDRYVIHSFLAKTDDLATESIGEEPERRIVIKLKA